MLINTHPARLLFAAATWAMLATAHAGWNRLPYAEARPVDVATNAIPGTKLESSTGLGNAQALLSPNLNDGVTLAAGKSSAVIQLGSQQNIHTIAFSNDGAEGKITVSGSLTTKGWAPLGSGRFSPEERVAQVHFATATAKYVSVAFESEKGGAIRGFDIYGDSSDHDYKLATGAAGSDTMVNFASGIGGARPIYAFPTPSNVGELGSLHNVFKFPKSREKYRTIVYDLSATRAITVFATAYSRQPVRVEVFTFAELPEKKDWRGKLTLDPAVFGSMQPTAVGEDPKGLGHIRIAPSKPVSARYVALRFQPNYQQGPAVGFFDAEEPDSVATAAGEQPTEQTGQSGSFVANDANTFTVSAVELRGLGGNGVAPAHEPTDEEKEGETTGVGSSVNTDNSGTNNPTGFGVPYVAGFPGAPPATLPYGTGTDTSNAASKGKSSKGTSKAGSVAPHSP